MNADSRWWVPLFINECEILRLFIKKFLKEFNSVLHWGPPYPAISSSVRLLVWCETNCRKMIKYEKETVCFVEFHYNPVQHIPCFLKKSYHISILNTNSFLQTFSKMTQNTWLAQESSLVPLTYRLLWKELSHRGVFSSWLAVIATF